MTNKLFNTRYAIIPTFLNVLDAVPSLSLTDMAYLKYYIEEALWLKFRPTTRAIENEYD